MKRKARTERVGSEVAEYRSVYGDIDRAKSRVIHLLWGAARSALLHRVAIDVSAGVSRTVGNSIEPGCKYTIESELCHRARRAAVQEPAGQPRTVQFWLCNASFAGLSGRTHSELRGMVSTKFRSLLRLREHVAAEGRIRAIVNRLVFTSMLDESQE